MPKLTFITGNAGKAKNLSDYFHLPVDHVKLDLREIQSVNLREVVEKHATSMRNIALEKLSAYLERHE